MKSFEISLKSHFRHLWSLIFLGFVFPFVAYHFAVYKLGDHDERTALILIVAIVGVLTLPVIALHLNHLLQNWKTQLLIDENNGELIFTKNGNQIRVQYDEIQSLECFKSWPLAESRPSIFPWDVYNFSIICLNSGMKIKISSLLVSELDRELKVDRSKVRKTFFAWI